MSGETFEEACRLVVEVLRSQGGSADVRTMVEELRRKGISRATTYRALDRLITIGVVRRAERGLYMLAEKSYALLAEELSRELCHLIRCENPERLRDDILRELGADVEKIDSTYNAFLNAVPPSFKDVGVPDFLISLLNVFYRNRALFTIIALGSLKPLVFKKLVNEGCNDVFIDLPNEYVAFLRKTAETNAENLRRLFGIDVDDVYDTYMRLGRILVKHGYRDIIWVRVLTTDIPIDMKEMITLGLSAIFGGIEEKGVKNVTQCFITLYDISDSLMVTGCRPLGSLERESLLKNCEGVVNPSQVASATPTSA